MSSGDHFGAEAEARYLWRKEHEAAVAARKPLDDAIARAERAEAEVARLREALTRSRATALRDALGEVARWTADMLERVDRAVPASEEGEG
jgi:transcription elongation GreA/GreB family factor